jgi:hypothetical protein
MKHRGKTGQLQLKPHGAAVDGVEYFRNIPEVRRKLEHSSLRSGPIWPVEEEEKRFWGDVSVTCLAATSHVIGGALEGCPALHIPLSEPILSASIRQEGGQPVIHGETASGKVTIESPGLTEASARDFVERSRTMRLVPLDDATGVFNACSTTKLGGKRRLILAKSDIRLVDAVFWKKIMLIGLERMGDIYGKAEEEFGKSSGGIIMRLRKMSEKLAAELNEDPKTIVEGLISSAALQSGSGDSLGWFMQRTTSEEDQFFVGMVAYTLMAMDGIDPTYVLDGVAKNLAENPQFRHEYRVSGREEFTTPGLTKLMYEAFVISLKKFEGFAGGESPPFAQAQAYARVSQFMLEMQEVIQRRNGFVSALMNGYETQG